MDIIVVYNVEMLLYREYEGLNIDISEYMRERVTKIGDLRRMTMLMIA